MKKYFYFLLFAFTYCLVKVISTLEIDISIKTKANSDLTEKNEIIKLTD